MNTAARRASTVFSSDATITDKHVPILAPRTKNILLSNPISPLDASIIITDVTADELCTIAVIKSPLSSKTKSFSTKKIALNPW